MEQPRGSLMDSYINADRECGEYASWDKLNQGYIYDPTVSFLEIVVPTKDTVRYSYLLRAQISIQKPVFVTGGTGVGKSVIIADTLNNMKDQNIFPIFLTFSAQTSSVQAENSIVSKLDSKRKDLLGGPGSKKVVIMIDDVNMPAVEQYGAQPPIELMRQVCDLGYIYDRSKHFPIRIIDTTIVCCAAPPGGGRSPLTPRFSRHFHMLCIPPTSEDAMNLIFKTILDGFYKLFKPDIQSLSVPIVSATINIYNQISTDLLPTPAKSHYTFNLRDISKVFQGVLMSDPLKFQNPDTMIKLWIHETSRVFHDRLINQEDKRWFKDQVLKQIMKEFRKDWNYEDLFESVPILFGDFNLGDLEAEDRYYEEMPDPKRISDNMYRFLEDYNLSHANQMNLVFFQDALEHLCRICRILRLPRGNAMLVGVGGSGKQSMTRLAAHICLCESFQIQITKNYGLDAFREDLKNLFIQTGGPDEKPTVFLMSDNQIVNESFLEDINNILNSGEVPNLFTKDEFDALDQDLRPIAAKKKIYDNMYNFFISRVQENLHLVMCMSPVGDSLRVRMRMFPSLVNCCTIDWVDPWPRDALLSVSHNKINEIEIDDMRKEDLHVIFDKLAQMCVEVHLSVEKVSEEFHQVLSRRVYITPKSYLDMMNLFIQLLYKKREELLSSRDRYRRGVDCLKKTNLDVIQMQDELTKLAPILTQKKIEADELSVKVEADTIEANKVKEVAEAEEREVNAQAQEVEAVQRDAQADLDEALPALEAANRALDAINPKDIAEIRTFAQPAALIRYTLEAVSILLEAKTDWDNIKRTLQQGFIDRLKNYPKDNISKPTLKKLRKKIADNPDFVPEKVGNVNLASKSLCLWVFAMDKYSKVSEEVAPKRAKLEEMNSLLAEAQGKLKITRDRLQAELDKVAKLEAQRQAAIDESERLAFEAQTTEQRLERASVLTVGLKDENERWQVTVNKISQQLNNVIGDVFLSAACVAYYGPFTGQYRNKLQEMWVDKCIEMNIQIGPNFDLKEVMGDPVTIREWNMQTLPTDSVSVNNAVVVTYCNRFPLLIDPQEQANKWIRKMNEKQGLKIQKQSDKNFAKMLETCIVNGYPLLVEDVGEMLDPSLDPILQKNLIEQGAGRYALRVGEQEIDYDPAFRMYLTTKIPNPHYLPEICIKTTLINFTVTTKGLEEQLLGDVVVKEKPKIEETKTKIIVTIASDEKKLKDLEDSILKSLTETKGNILDDAKLIENLKNSKEVSLQIAERMVKSEETKKVIEETREQYQPVAVRGSILYFVIADLGRINPMYQFSLNYFTRLFNTIIETSRKSEDIEERIRILNEAITEIIFMNVCRGLFNVNKLIFSFLITVQIMRNTGEIQDSVWSLLLKGVSLVPASYKRFPNPSSSRISEKAWEYITVLQNICPDFKEPLLSEQITNNLDAWLEWIYEKEPQDMPIPEPFTDIPDFSKLLLLKAFREEKLIYGIINFVGRSLGKKFVEVPPTNMVEVFNDSSFRTPIIFILSTGADPSSMMTRLAEELDFTEKLDVMSLGKGQGDRAKLLIEAACKSGRWVVLQNCHLAKSWMPTLEKIVEGFDDPKARINHDFRVFLSSMPVEYFPVPVLQNGVKVTIEPPKGIKANLTRSLNTFSDEMLQETIRPEVWKKLLFSLSFFHAVIQERRKFGPLGWNIRYEFNDSDLETSITVLNNFLQEESIPWDAMKVVTGDINYGGRVTDDWDRRCLMSILDLFMAPKVLQEDYKFSKSGRYYIPQGSLADLKNYVDSFPISDDPEIFGMHENANITFQMQESGEIVSTALSIQPKDTGGGSAGKSPDQVVDELAQSILELLPNPMSQSEAETDIFARDSNGLMDSMSTFLGQEMVRFNLLLTVMKKTLKELRDAIKGLVVMSGSLDAMYTSMLNNMVPKLWADVAYPSLKPLSPWVSDLIQRIQFIRKWLTYGLPDAFWLSSFFFPQGFLTAVLQNYSRKFMIAIDTLDFTFEFQTFYDVEEITEVPEHGCYIYGLYMEGCKWDTDSMQLEEANPGEMYFNAPVIGFNPTENPTPDAEDYAMPVYKTSVRAGVLSTTGHSTNFVIAVQCPTSVSPQNWVQRGSAFLCQLND